MIDFDGGESLQVGVGEAFGKALEDAFVIAEGEVGVEGADDVDFANSEMLEKLDGTMVGAFFPKGTPNEPYWHTRRMVSLGPSDSSQDGGGKMMPVIDKCVKTRRRSICIAVKANNTRDGSLLVEPSCPASNTD